MLTTVLPCRPDRPTGRVPGQSVDSERMFPMVGESRTRDHSLRLMGLMRLIPFRTDVRRNFFTQRVVNE